MVGSYARLGSVSSGTMRLEDVIPAYLDALGDIRERIAGYGPDGSEVWSVV